LLALENAAAPLVRITRQRKWSLKHRQKLLLQSRLLLTLLPKQANAHKEIGATAPILLSIIPIGKYVNRDYN